MIMVACGGQHRILQRSFFADGAQKADTVAAGVDTIGKLQIKQIAQQHQLRRRPAGRDKRAEGCGKGCCDRLWRDWIAVVERHRKAGWRPGVQIRNADVREHVRVNLPSSHLAQLVFRLSTARMGLTRSKPARDMQI